MKYAYFIVFKAVGIFALILHDINWQLDSGFRLGINDSFMHIPNHPTYEDSWIEFQQNVSFYFCKLVLDSTLIYFLFSSSAAESTVTLIGLYI